MGLVTRHIPERGKRRGKIVLQLGHCSPDQYYLVAENPLVKQAVLGIVEGVDLKNLQFAHGHVRGVVNNLIKIKFRKCSGGPAVIIDQHRFIQVQGYGKWPHTQSVS